MAVAAEATPLDRATEAQIESRRSTGEPLRPPVREFFASSMGANFAGVRIHADPEAGRLAKQLHARAFTSGTDVFFGPGEYGAGTPEGDRVLAHELTHVLQQAGGGPATFARAPGTVVQREDGDDDVVSESVGSFEPTEEARLPAAPLHEARSARLERVQRIVISCRDMRLRLETSTSAYIYTLEECSIPLGSYDTRVTVTEEDFRLDFGPAVSAEEEFVFRYRVEAGQENPARLLREQESVHVDVVRSVPRPRVPRPREERRTPACVVQLDDRELVPTDSLRRNLFEPISFDRTIWSHSIPLGGFGWVDVSATALGRLSGTFTARYGPGRLTDICLLYLAGSESSSAPIEHPMLGEESRADVTTYRIGGRARFVLPASAVIRLMGSGRLRIAGEYLSVIDVVAVEGGVSALGEARLQGEINGAVDIVAEATLSRATLAAPVPSVLPVRLIIEHSSISGVDLAAQIGLRGRAGLAFRIDADAALELAGFKLWEQSWNLARFNAGVGWSGGLKYSPNPGVDWDLGMLGREDELDLGPADDDEYFDTGFREDAADIEEGDVIDSILDDTNAHVAAPTGLSEDEALPFVWHKVLELYPERLDLPRAEEPAALNRDDGPTTVRYLSGGRSVYEDIGVAAENWPHQDKTFQFVPHAGRSEPEKNRLRRLLDRLGFDRSGTDVDHVHELQFGGDDHFDNLWPADNSGNRSAGTRHQQQLENYEAQLGNLAGRWFVIARISV